MFKLTRTVFNFVCSGTRIILAAIHKSLAEEVEMSRQAARLRYQDEQNAATDNDRKFKLTVDEAMQILNLETLDPEHVQAKYKSLFEANSRGRGGSFYLQSKIFRAHERIQAEIGMAKIAEKKSKV